MTEILINDYGLVAIFLLMALNGFFSAPPSELVLPLAGLLALSQEYTLTETIIAAASGNLAGTTLLYLLGRRFGLTPVLRLRGWILSRNCFPETIRKVLPSEERLVALATALTGREAYLVGLLRCVPYVRSIISVPAGFVRMPLSRFTAYSGVGIVVWTVAWELVGYLLGTAWKERAPKSVIVGIMAFVVTCVIVWNGWRIVRTRHHLDDSDP